MSYRRLLRRKPKPSAGSGVSIVYPDTVLATPGLVAYWKLDETTGDAIDSVAARNGLVSGPVRGVASLVAGSTNGKCYDFDGTDWIQATNNVVFSPQVVANGGKLSVEAWVKPRAFPASGQYATIISKGASGNYEWALRLDSTGAPTFSVWQLDGNDERISAGSVPLTLNQTAHIVVTYENNVALRIYINGVEQGSNTGFGTAVTTAGTAQVQIGRRGDAVHYFNGYIDEVALYNVALAPSVITNHYSVGTTGVAGGVDAVPTITSGPTVSSITSAGATVAWSLSEGATGRVKYGTTSGSYPNMSTLEPSFTYSSHTQGLTGLSPTTQYYARVFGQDSAGQAYESNEFGFTTTAVGTSNLRVMAYYVDYRQDVAPNWAACTDLMAFSAAPNANGTLTHYFTSGERAALVTAKNAAGKKMHYSLGGAGRGSNASGFCSASSRTAAVNAMAAIIDEGFDGIDFDFEDSLNVADFKATVQALKAARPAAEIFLTFYPGADQTVAARWLSLEPITTMFNMMTYDLGGPYEGWERWWHHNAMTDKGLTQAGGIPMLSIKNAIENFTTAGWPANKLAFGIAAYAHRIIGGNGAQLPYPGLLLTGGEYDDGSQTDYTDVRANHWTNWGNDSLVGSYTRPNNTTLMTFDDETSIPHKWTFAQNQGVGGMLLWYQQAIRSPYTAPNTTLANLISS